MKNIFWKGDDDKQKVPPTHQETATSKPTQSPASILSSKPTAVQPSAASIEIDTTDTKQFDDYFNDVMEKANLPGPDYFEFEKALLRLQNKPMDEGTKFSSVYAGFEAQGCTVQKLVESNQTYQQICAEKKNAFDTEYEKTSSSIIGSLENEQQQLESRNKELLSQIAEMNKEIEGNSERSTELSKTMETKKIQLNTRKISFDAVYKRTTERFVSNLAKINQFLTNS